MVETRLQRVRYFAARNWASMNTDILCSIFSRLSYVDLLHVKVICWGWHEAIDVFKSCSSSSFTEMPWLIYTPDTEGEKNGRFVNFEENKTYPFNDLAVKEMNHGGSYSSYCVGSSHDWLICLNGRAVPYLLNPFSSRRIDLPRFGMSLGVVQVWGKGNNCCIETVGRDRIDRNRFVSKAVLSSSPSFDNKYYLVIIYGIYKLAFCKDGDTSWTKLHSNEHGCFDDILFHENNLYGVYKDFDTDGHMRDNLKVWGMNQDGLVLEENKVITMAEISNIFHIYLVESQGSLLVVQRFVLYNRAGSLDAKFHVFKLGNLLKRVTCLSGFALFLGRNQSISLDVRNCKMLRQDAIYINDPTRHISGVFSLKDDSSCDWLYEKNREIPDSVPTWVVPPMKQLDWKSSQPN